MRTVFVSRHPGAADWAGRRWPNVEVVPHFVPDGSPVRVIGTLPVQLAAAVCVTGGEYWHLSLNLPAEWRGRELSADDMDACGALVQRFDVRAA